MSGDQDDAYTALYFPHHHQIPVSGVKDVLRHGWLTKQGGRISTWKRRWCVLSSSGGVLYYYKSQKDAKPAGFIPLDECHVRRGGSKKAFAFEIAHAHRRTFCLFADAEADLYSWLADLESVIAQLRAKADAVRDAVWTGLVRPSLLHSSSSRSSPSSPGSSMRGAATKALRARSHSLEDLDLDDDDDDDLDLDDALDDDDDATQRTDDAVSRTDPSVRLSDRSDDSGDDAIGIELGVAVGSPRGANDRGRRASGGSGGSSRPSSLANKGRSVSQRKWTTLNSLSKRRSQDASSNREAAAAATAAVDAAVVAAAAAGSPSGTASEVVSWRVLSALLGARAQSAAHADALRFLLFATVLPSTKWLENPLAALEALEGDDLLFVTRQQLNYFAHVFGAYEKWLSWCVPLGKCYHGALAQARARALLESASVGSYLVRLVPQATAPLSPTQMLRMVDEGVPPPTAMPEWADAPHLVIVCRAADGVHEHPVRREPNTLYHYVHGDTIWPDIGAMIKNMPALTTPYTAPVALWHERFATADKAARDPSSLRFSATGEVVARRRVKMRVKSDADGDAVVVSTLRLSGSMDAAPDSNPTSPRKVTVADQLKVAMSRRFARKKADSDESPLSLSGENPNGDVPLSARGSMIAAQLEVVKYEKARMEEQAAAKRDAEALAHAELLAAAARCPLTNEQLRRLVRERHVRAQRVAAALADERRAETAFAIQRAQDAVAEMRRIAAGKRGSVITAAHPAAVELRKWRGELKRWTSDDPTEAAAALRLLRADAAHGDADAELYERAAALLTPLPFEASARHLWRIVPIAKAQALLDAVSDDDDQINSMGGSGFITAPYKNVDATRHLLELELRAALEHDTAFLTAGDDEPVAVETRGRFRSAGDEFDSAVLEALKVL